MANFPAPTVTGTDPSVIPYTNATVSVTSTATSISSLSTRSTLPILVTNGSGTTVYLGNSDVTTATGFPLAVSTSVLVTYGEPRPTTGGVACGLYGVTASSSSTVTYSTPT